MGAKQSFPRVQIPKERTFVVTGANRGIGYEITKWIAMLGGTVVLACRSADDAMKAIRNIDKEYKEEKAKGTEGLVDVSQLSLIFMSLDLSSLESSEEFVKAYKESGLPLHVLICNAGVAKTKPEITKDGFEEMLQVNYLSHFLLIGQLLPVLKKSGEDVRIILVSSDAYRMCRFDLDTINYTGDSRSFGPLDYYGRTKLYQIMQMHCLHRRLRNSNVSVIAAHPGLVGTNLAREFQETTIYNVFLKMSKFTGMMKTPFDGATTIINCATNPLLEGVSGIYYKDCRPASTSNITYDEVQQEHLWEMTMKLLIGHFTEEEILCLQGVDV